MVTESASPARRPLSRTASLAGTDRHGRMIANGFDAIELLDGAIEESN
jgi:hypothetical protein